MTAVTSNLEEAAINSYKKRNKAELPQEGIIFALNDLPWEFLLIKKLEIEKTKTSKNTTFKTDVIKEALVF